MSSMTSWDDKNDLFFWMPMYAQVFWGMVKACLYAHVEFTRQQGGKCLRIEDIASHFK